jgi:hypothetical protein
VVDLIEETPRSKSLLLEPPAWPGHRAGQHVDVRLTADDGWKRVSVDAVLEGVGGEAQYVTAWCDGGYTTKEPDDINPAA